MEYYFIEPKNYNSYRNELCLGGKPEFIDKGNLIKFHKANLWIELLFEASPCGENIDDLWEHLLPSKITKTRKYSTPRRIRRGIHLPKPNTLKSISEKYPEAYYWLNMPFWTIITRDMKWEEVKIALQSCNYDIKSKIFKIDHSRNCHFSYREYGNHESLRKWLLANTSIRTFNALLLLLVEDEYQGNVKERSRYLRCLCHMLCILGLKGSIKKHYFFIFNAIQKRFFYGTLEHHENKFYRTYPHDITVQTMVSWLSISEKLLNFMRFYKKRYISTETKNRILRDLFFLNQNKLSTLSQEIEYGTLHINNLDKVNLPIVDSIIIRRPSRSIF